MIDTYLSFSEKQTQEIAQALAEKMSSGALILLYGNLGSGKTVFSKGFAEALGIPPDEVKSPTYTYVREHKKGKKHLYHYDFYRLETLDELMIQDLQEIFTQKNTHIKQYIIVEWPERIETTLPTSYIKIVFEYVSPNSRKITIQHERK